MAADKTKSLELHSESTKKIASFEDLLKESLKNESISRDEAKSILEKMGHEKKDIQAVTRVEWMRLNVDVRKKVLNAIGTTEDTADGVYDALQKLATSAEVSRVSETVNNRTVKTIDVTAVAPAVWATEKINTSTSDIPKLSLLSDLNGSGAIDADSKDFVSEKQLKKALSRAEVYGGLNAVYERVVWSAPDWTNPQETTKKFQEALRTSVSIIRQLTGGHAGLNAFLEGKTEAFFNAVQKRVTKEGGKPLQVIVDNGATLSTSTHNVLGALATAGVAIVTGGMVTVGHEKHDMIATDFMKEVKVSTEKTFGEKASSVLSYIKEAFMGRKLSITFGRERVAEYVKKVTEYATEVMRLTKDTPESSINNPELKNAFSVAMNTAKTMNLNLTTHFDTIQKVLIQSYIVGEGFKDQGSNWSGSIGLLMLAWVHRDEISLNTSKTKNSSYNEAEKESTNNTVNESDYKKSGIKIEKNDGKWVYTIPPSVKLPGDEEAINVHHTSQLSTGGNGAYTFDTAQKLTFSDNGDGGYTLGFSPTDAAPNVSQKVKQVVNLRERETKNEKFAYQLFFMGHTSYFNKVIEKLARQDYDGAKKLLTTMSKKGEYRTFAKNLLSDKNTVDISTWTSYMYGSSASRAEQAYTQEYADKKVRTKATIAAEARLSKQLGISATVQESKLRADSGKNYKGVQASMFFPEQTMTIASFATPDKAIHRLDTFDGSVTMSDKKVLMDNSTEKRSIIEVIYKNTNINNGIQNQLDNLNKFIKDNSGTTEVTLDAYMSYLASGTMDSLNVPGLTLQLGKEPKIFEGRAMIAGNVCLNRLYGIVYPAFELGGVTQETAPAVSVDYSTPLNDTSVKIQLDALWVNTLGVVKALEHPPGPKNPTTTPGETPTGPVNQGGTPIVPGPVSGGNTGTTGFTPH